MRNAFASTVTQLAESNESLVLLYGDIGNRLFNSFKERFPERIFNCGVAEANMTGVAAGMALCGLRPVTYTITPFNTYRCYEQIRVDVCFQNLPVIIVGVGSGLSYASLGATHHSCEDIAVMRVLPNMTVICPGDPIEVKCALKAALDRKSPVYIRIGKKGEPVVHKIEPDFKIGKCLAVKDGTDICILSTGTILAEVLKASDILERNNISAKVVSMHTIKPLDKEFLMEASKKYKLLATVEEHSIIGGLGSAVAEWLNQSNIPNPAPLLCIGTPDKFLLSTGEQESARYLTGLTPENINRKIMEKISGL